MLTDCAPGSYIPEWTPIRVPLYSLQRGPRHFGRPDAFVPDRWLAVADPQAHTDEKLAHNAAAFAPFSVRPRSCVGKNLAALEMKMLLVAHVTEV